MLTSLKISTLPISWNLIDFNENERLHISHLHFEWISAIEFEYLTFEIKSSARNLCMNLTFVVGYFHPYWKKKLQCFLHRNCLHRFKKSFTKLNSLPFQLSEFDSVLKFNEVDTLKPSKRIWNFICIQKICINFCFESVTVSILFFFFFLGGGAQQQQKFGSTVLKLRWMEIGLRELVPLLLQRFRFPRPGYDFISCGWRCSVFVHTLALCGDMCVESITCTLLWYNLMLLFFFFFASLSVFFVSATMLLWMYIDMDWVVLLWWKWYKTRADCTGTNYGNRMIERTNNKTPSTTQPHTESYTTNSKIVVRFYTWFTLTNPLHTGRIIIVSDRCGSQWLRFCQYTFICSGVNNSNFVFTTDDQNSLISL